MARKRAKCTVEFRGETAILFDRHGHSVNVMNYPRGHRFTTKEKARARRRLMAGCAEFSRKR